MTFIAPDRDRRLLIVDDDTVFLRTLSRAMQRRGYAVVATADFDHAASEVDAAPPTHAVLDLNIGERSGLDLLRRLVSASPSARAVILTGYGSVATAVAAAKLGAVDFMAKPADADSIEAALVGRPLAEMVHQTFMSPEEQEFYYLLTMYEQHHRNMSETARAIGMHRRTLQRILRRKGIAASPRALAEPPSDKRRALRLYRLWTMLLGGRRALPGSRTGEEPASAIAGVPHREADRDAGSAGGPSSATQST